MCSPRSQSALSFYILTNYHLDKDKEKDLESQGFLTYKTSGVSLSKPEEPRLSERLHKTMI